MRQYSILLTLFLTTFFYTNVHAQQTVAEKVIGCWEFDTIEFLRPEDAVDVSRIVKPLLCIKKDGTYTTTANGTTVNGTFMISDDGKTMTQRIYESVDTSEITLLNDNFMECSTDRVIIRFKKVKTP